MKVIKDSFLFLDDIREPEDVYDYMSLLMYKSSEDTKWDIVRNYNEFVDYITKNGLPTFISFDHDLAASHYTPEHLWSDYAKSKAWQDAQVHEEKTGYDCAVWLLKYCKAKKLKLPLFVCHSQNPVGRDKINNLMDEYFEL